MATAPDDSTAATPTAIDPATVPWRPTGDEVANLLRARTKDAQGTEAGEWSEDTRPTATEVEGLIDQAVRMLGSRYSVALGDPCADGARSIASLYAAMLVELSYFPEQVRSDRSPYEHYRSLYDSALVSLDACVEAHGDGTTGGQGVGLNYWSVPIIPETTFRSAIPADYWPEPENPANWRLPWQPPREPPHPEDLPVGDEPASGRELR